MDLTLNNEQEALQDAVRLLAERHAGPERARALGEDGYDTELFDALAGSGFFDVWAEPEVGPLGAELVVEGVARALGRVHVGARALVAPAVLGPDVPGPVALAVAGATAPVRFGAHAAALLVLDGDDARALSAAEASPRPTPGRFEYPMATVATDGGRPLGRGSGDLLRRWWQVSLAAEMAATSAAALAMTVDYLKERHQFGRPLASFQAIQHRLAEAEVWVRAGGTAGPAGRLVRRRGRAGGHRGGLRRPGGPAGGGRDPAADRGDRPHPRVRLTCGPCASTRCASSSAVPPPITTRWPVPGGRGRWPGGPARDARHRARVRAHRPRPAPPPTRALVGPRLCAERPGALTYGELDRRSRNLAAALLERGVGKGTRVGVLFPNGPDWVVAWAAACRLGAVVLPVNTF